MTELPRTLLLALGALFTLSASLSACGEEFVGGDATVGPAAGEAGRSGSLEPGDGGASASMSGGASSGGSLGGAPDVGGGAGAGPALPSYAELVLAESPVAYWRLGSIEDARVLDASGHDNDLVLQGGGHEPVLEGALSSGDDGALGFDGEASFAIASDARALDFSAGAAFSLECWARRSSGGSSYFQHLLSNVDGVAGSRNGYALYLVPEPSTDDSARSVFEFDRPAADLGLWGELIGEAAWGHYVATFDGSVARLYVNATLADAESIEGPLVLRTGPFSVARSAGGGSFFKGALDEIAVYPRALTAQAIAQHFAFGRR